MEITSLVDFIRSGGLCIILTHLAKITGLVVFIRSEGLWALLTALMKITSLVDFIRSGGLCIILTRLAKITKLVVFIRSGGLWAFIDHPCGNYEPCYWNMPGTGFKFTHRRRYRCFKLLPLYRDYFKLFIFLCITTMTTLSRLSVVSPFFSP
jgi:hypothetical protein